VATATGEQAGSDLRKEQVSVIEPNVPLQNCGLNIFLLLSQGISFGTVLPIMGD